MMVSRVDMKTLDSPASTILVTNSEGARYDIDGSFCFLRERSRPPARAIERGLACRARGDGELEALGLRHDDRAEEGREAVELPGCSRQRLHQCGKAAVFVDVNGEASCVPCAGLIKSKQHQSGRALAAPAFALDAAFCLGCCTTVVRRTIIGQPQISRAERACDRLARCL